MIILLSRRFRLVLLVGALSCRPAAPLFAPTPSSIDAGFNQSWNAVIDVLAEENVPVKTLDRSSGFVVAEVSSMSISQLSELTTNCGGVLDLLVNSKVPFGIANYNILIRGDSSVSTVKVTARFVHGSTECSSKNLFENRFQTAVKSRAEAGRHTVQPSVSQIPVAPTPAASTTAPPRRAMQPPPPPSDLAVPSGTRSQAMIGAPRSESDRLAAIDAFAEGNAYLGNHEWARAEQSFQKALLYDGSVAKYHAALGSLMMLLHRWGDAEASYSAAVLIDVDNPEYRRQLKEARARR